MKWPTPVPVGRVIFLYSCFLQAQLAILASHWTHLGSFKNSQMLRLPPREIKSESLEAEPLPSLYHNIPRWLQTAAEAGSLCSEPVHIGGIQTDQPGW